MEKCHFVGVAPIEPLGLFLAERACRDDDVDREVHEAALVDDQEVQLEQPGKQSAAFLVFRLFPGAAFSQVSRKRAKPACPRLDLLDVAMVSWLLKRSHLARSLDRRQI